MPATLTPPPFPDVTVDDDFWNSRRETNRTVTLAAQYDQMQETGRVDNFRKAAGEMDGEFVGRRYNDSDVYKWVEAVSYVLASGDHPDLRDKLDDVVDAIVAAQREDGYLNTYFQLVEPGYEWTNLRQHHELYCAGHLVEAAIAHTHATGEDRLLDVATRLADHICDRFGPDGKRGYPGHEEIELALVALARETGESRYVETAAYFLDQRGTEPSRFVEEVHNAEGIAGDDSQGHDLDRTYYQDHAPVREQDTVDGHAVRAVYLYSGMADVAAETGDETLVEALEDLWENMTTRRMYVTGGIGATSDGEAFGEDYELPNQSAYAETCAAAGSVFWNHRLLRMTGESRFADVIERTLYNGLISGVSLDGDRFFYTNPLASDGDHERQEWFDCACCPPNAARLIASLEKYVYLQGNDRLLVNLYVGSEVDTTLAGTDVTVTQETDFPWDGEATFEVDPAEETRFALSLRVPDWARDATVEVNGEAVDPDVDDGYASIEREWSTGDEVTLSVPMPVEQVACNPRVEANRERVALQRGPVVFCVEGHDAEASPGDLRVPSDATFDVEFRPDRFDGVVTLSGEATVPDHDDWDGALYRPRDETGADDAAFTAIPYYAWAHRDPAEMRVWLHTDD